MEVRLVTLLEKLPVPIWEPSVVVAVTVERLARVPYAKPCWLESDPPVEMIEPFKVAVVEAIFVVELVETAEIVEGVTRLEALEALPVPTILVAVTVNVYGVPFTRPVTV